ncbi:MAG TPA: DUF6247 family protein [Pseudonocardiaceae bacterium]|jgi:hypothetical protein|nr:DUF6247 family protein [Pseudonocardiaceae bacterium]
MAAEAVDYDDYYDGTLPVPVFPPEATPIGIRDALIEEERGEFVRAYREAMTEATQTFNLDPVLTVLRNYRHIAAVTEEHGPEAYRGLLAKAAEIARTGENPDASTEDDMMALINNGLGRQMYRIVPDAEVIDQIAALPAKALPLFAETIEVPRLVPKNGSLLHSANPDGLREVFFGPGGKLTYLVLEDQREVHLLRLVWAGEVDS